jgi:hypothetical protein
MTLSVCMRTLGITMINIYPSIISEEPLERHSVQPGIGLYRWLCENVTGFALHDTEHPISVFVGGEQQDEESWHALDPSKLTIDIYIQPKGSALPWVIGAIFASVVISRLLAPKIKMPNQVDRVEGRKITLVETAGNQVRFGEIVPDVAGSPRRYPDYLNQPRKRFGADNKTQIQNMLFCVGRGQHQLSTNNVFMGETRLSALSGIDLDVRVYQPGQSIDHPSAQNWYNVPEVGGTRSSSGIMLESGQDGTPFATAQVYNVSGTAISIPIGLGETPQDWEVGNKVRITLPIRTVTIQKVSGQRDQIRGFFSDLSLSAGDEISMRGIGADLSRLRIHSYAAGNPSTGGSPGTPSTIVGSEVAATNFSAHPVVIQINGSSVLLNQNYVNHNSLINAINNQVAGIVASQSAGIVTLTQTSPYNGSAISVSELIEELFGDEPVATTGTSTVPGTPATMDTITLDIGADVQVNEWNVFYFQWLPLTSLSAGTRTSVAIEKAGTEYAIDGMVYEVVLDENEEPGNVIIGWEFTRLLPNGAIDPNWSGFPSGTYSNLTLAFDNDQSVGGWAGPYELVPNGTQTAKIEWDLMAPSGLGFVRDNGSIQALSRQIQFQWSTDGVNWTSAPQTISGATQDQLGWTFTVNLPSPVSSLKGRFRRVGAEDTRVQAMDKLELYGVRTLTGSKTLYSGVTVLAVQMSGSDVLSAQTENKLWCNVTRVLPARTGGEWGVAAPTRHIADFLGYIAHDIGYTDDQIDLVELDRLHDIWSSRGDLFDHVFDGGTVRDAMNLALQAGFAELTIHRGKIRPVRDEPRTVYDHPYTRENMTGPLRSRVKMLGKDEHDGVDVEYINRDTWTKEVVQCRLPGDQGYKIKKINLQGVTDRTRAWRIGMRERRTQRYIRWQYSFKTEMDALNSKYGDYVPLIDNVPGYGYAGVIKTMTRIDANTVTVRVSEPYPFESGENHIFAWRKQDGSLSGPYPAQAAANADQITVTMTVAQQPTLDRTKEPIHYLVGTEERFCFPAIIRGINPNNLTDVSVEAENYDERKYADDNNAPLA